MRLSSHRVLPPLLIGIVALLAVRSLAATRIPEAWTDLRAALDAYAPAFAVLLATLVVGIAIAYSSRVAAGPDPYGYVSQAELWMRGRLTQDDALAFTLANRFSPRVFAPLGYRPGEARGTIVPTYPPGLPMAMAAFGLAFGRNAMFLVVPLSGGLLVCLAYGLGCRIGDRLDGLASAALVATHPSFQYHVLQPMSDVPAATAWTAALLLASRPGRGRALGAGLAGSAAILIRPNLAPLSVGVALLLYRLGPRAMDRLAAYATGLVPGIVTVAIVNNMLYGSPFLTGYGDVGSYFRVTHVPVNLALYTRWLLETQGPLLFLALLAPLAYRRRFRTESGVPRPPLVGFVVYGVTLIGIYALYLPFPDWTFLRFLLPGIPLAAALAFAVRPRLSGLTASARAPILMAIVTASCAWGARFIKQESLLGVALAEERYVTVSRYVQRAFPERTVFLSMLYSGSLRYYAQRETIRYDWIDPGRFEPLLDRLERLGYQPMILLELWEEPQFRRRFAADAKGALDWPPAARLEAPTIVSIWDPRDRSRHLRGETVATRLIE